MKNHLISTLLAGAAIGTMAVAAVALIDTSNTPGPSSASAAVPPDSSGSSQPDSSGPAAGDPVRTVTVAGTGTITVAPDTAHVNLGVAVTADTAERALDMAAEKANALITTLKATGVAEADIRTTGLSLYPEYDDDYENITGYNVSNSVDVTVRAIADTGSIIDAAAGFVGDAITISGISFSVEDDTAALADARAAAIADAQLRSEQFTAAAGETVGEVLTISEVTTSAPQPIYYAGEAADSAASTPIQAGTQDVAVDVTVTFAIS